MDENAILRSGNAELEAILEEVKRARSADGEETGEPSKIWSVEDIDRLIAVSSGEEYVPAPKKEVLTPAEDFERILKREFDSAIFAVKPISGEEPEENETTDVSSSSGESEVEGQELFFDSRADGFDGSAFEIETVVVPEDEPKPPSPRFAWQNSEGEAEEKKKEKKPVEIKTFYEGEIPIDEIFGGLDKGKNRDKIADDDHAARFFAQTKFDAAKKTDADLEEDGLVERSGIVVTKTGEKDETGLEAPPKALAAEDARKFYDEKTRVIERLGEARRKAASAGDDVEGQIVLAGFEDSDEDSPEQSKEKDVETATREKRRSRAKNFRLTDAVDLDSDFSGDFEIPPEETAREKRAARKRKKKLARENEENLPVANDYSSPADRAAFYARLRDENRKASIGLAAVAAVEAVALILNLIPLATARLSIESSFFAPGSRALSVVSAAALITAAAINSEKFFDGLAGLFKRRITSDTAISLSVVAALVQNALAATLGGSEANLIFSPAAITAVFIGKIAEKIDAQRILKNFEVCAYKYGRNMYAVKEFESDSEIFELGGGLMMGNASLLYSAKLAFPTDFLKNSRSDANRGKLAGVLVYAALAAAFTVGLAAGAANKSFTTAIAAFAGTFCVCSPVFSSFAPALVMRIANAGLNPEGTMIASARTAEKFAAANAVVMDSADVFDRSRCKMHGMKDFKNMRIDDALLYAAAMVVKSGGPLREIFEQAVGGRRDLLPPVKEINYEDKLGMTARIHGQKVLLGNRNLLIHHNIEVPEKADEKKYLNNERKAVYLAAAGKIAALFVVGYAPDDKLTVYFRKMEKYGVQTLVRANDVNVTKELLAGSFGLPSENFGILSAVAGRLFKRRREAVCDKLPAEIIHDGTAYSALKAIAACCSISSVSKLGAVVQIIISAAGFILCAALYIASLSAFVNGLTATAFLGVGLALSAAAAGAIKIG